MTDAVSVKGMWEGAYQYSSSSDVGDFPFKARLTENDGKVSGLVVEEDLNQGTGTIRAQIEGTIEGRVIRFTKTYIEASNTYARPVEYDCEVNTEGDRITGTWRLPDDGGTFSMRRVG
ncbi:hypothetical protein [Aurantiacibacter sp. D1-12]|uniref:hypothetical protein n=1 Tax=Aurantiacibacter sp. D1-12 TaxID=2993658 RepID=UPI00237C750A|nr:hypothetical protein [Aurantiacibacter sp. D1-12]MDE1466149.1 hypothetical protein [Aurantiacibacter sp. D1-12]